MTNIAKFLIGGAAICALAAPATAQYQNSPYQPTYPQQYQQTYPQQYQYQQGYGYQQGYAQNPVGQIIDQLLGNRYNVTDRTAVSQCATAAMAQASAQYGGYGSGNGYNRGYGYNGYSNLRVTSITDVQRRNNGLRVSGLMSSGYGAQYEGQYGYQNRGHRAQELSFRCNVDYRGAVTNIRIRQRSSHR